MAQLALVTAADGDVEFAEKFEADGGDADLDYAAIFGAALAVDEVVETGKVTDQALSICRKLRQKDSKLFEAMKRSLNLTGQMSDDELDAMTISDLKLYLEEESSAEARARFLGKNKKVG